MRPVWEEPRTLPAAGRGPDLSFRQRRRLRHLHPPIDDPETAALWRRLDAEQQGELMRLAAARGTAEVAHHAVVVAALQRQIERRAHRDALPGLLVSLAIIATFSVLDPDLWAPQWWGAMVAAMGGGFLGEAERSSSPRRANERLARQGGHRSGDGPAPRWGLDRPMSGDPLFGVALIVAGFLWVLRPLGEGLHTTLRVWLLLPALTVGVALVLVTVRAVLRRARDR